MDVNPKGDELHFVTSKLLEMDEQICNINTEPTKQVYYQHQFLYRICKHLLTLNLLRTGFTLQVNGLSKSVYDYTSIILIGRSIFEATLMHYHIFNNQQSDNLKALKFLCWNRQGLMPRQRFAPVENEHKSKRLNEGVLLDDMTTLIESNPEYPLFIKGKSKGEQSRFKKYGVWAKPWNQIMAEMGMREPFRSSIYSFQSSHAHSEYLNYLQVSQMDKTDDVIQQMNNQIDTMIVPMVSIFILNFLSFFPHSITISDLDREKCMRYYNAYMQDASV